MKKSELNDPKTVIPTEPGSINNIYENLHSIIQLNCVIDGEELSWRDVKKTLNNEHIDEIKIFGISNKLYKEIINYLQEEGIKYTLYGKSRIVLEHF